MPVLESLVERWTCKKLGADGYLCFKLNVRGFCGLPDRLILGPSRYILFVEFKREDKDPDDLQIYIHKALNKFGFEVRVITGRKEAEALVDELTKTL